MSKKKEHFDLHITDEENLIVESNNFIKGVSIPMEFGSNIEQVINALELLKEDIHYLINDLVEHAQELEDG